MPEKGSAHAPWGHNRALDLNSTVSVGWSAVRIHQFQYGSFALFCCSLPHYLMAIQYRSDIRGCGNMSNLWTNSFTAIILLCSLRKIYFRRVWRGSALELSLMGRTKGRCLGLQKCNSEGPPGPGKPDRFSSNQLCIHIHVFENESIKVLVKGCLAYLELFQWFNHFQQF